MNYVKPESTKEGIEIFIAAVAGPGSGKTFLCYHLLQLAMSGKLGSQLEALSEESKDY